MRLLIHSKKIKLQRGKTADDVILCTASQTVPSFNYNFNEGLYRAVESTRGPQKIKRESGKCSPSPQPTARGKTLPGRQL